MSERTPAGLRTKPKRPTLSLGEAPQFIFDAPMGSDRAEVDLLPIDEDSRILHRELELVPNKTLRITGLTAVAAGTFRFVDAIREFISVSTDRDGPVPLVGSQEFAPFYDRYGLDTSTRPARPMRSPSPMAGSATRFGPWTRYGTASKWTGRRRRQRRLPVLRVC